MSDVILQESSSQRNDQNVWVWRYADAVFTPFRVSLYRRDAVDISAIYVDIPVGFYARFLIKDDLRDESAIIDKSFRFDVPSVFVVDIPTDEVVMLRPGKMYHVGVALYDNNDNFVRAIIDDLPLRVDNSVLSYSVF